MPEDNRFAKEISVFHGRKAPEPGKMVGYAAIISHYQLAVPLPERLSMISQRRALYDTGEWLVLSHRHEPEDTLMGHLTFALKYEGVDLAVLRRLFLTIKDVEIREIISAEPTGQYSRRIWFIYEWLIGKQLDIPDAATGNYVDVLDETIQYGSTAENSRRHRVRNNFPGVPDFCPMIRQTPALKKFREEKLSEKIKSVIGKIHPDVMARTAAFLLLKDSKASYAIEGEHPAQNRAQRWGLAIGQAGRQPISKEELVRLQQIVIDNPRFTKMGLRTHEGFIGEHDRRHGTPIPDHISAKYKDLERLIDGLIAADQKLEHDEGFDAVMAAAVIGFGFVFIHPLVDGNGRLHRYLLHHVLLRKNYVTKGLIFPVSAIMLERIDEYRQVLESYSRPRIALVEWKPTPDNNVEVLNETIDLYRYFDATRVAEFLYQCVKQTIDKTIPEEVDYLEKYDRFKQFIDNTIDMPDKTVALLVRFLEQGAGKLSQRAKEKEFAALTHQEIAAIEEKYDQIFIQRISI